MCMAVAGFVRQGKCLIVSIFCGCATYLVTDQCPVDRADTTLPVARFGPFDKRNPIKQYVTIFLFLNLLLAIMYCSSWSLAILLIVSLSCKKENVKTLNCNDLVSAACNGTDNAPYCTVGYKWGTQNPFPNTRPSQTGAWCWPS